ncbi:MAG: hypothetical protein WBQ73_02625 [Candidatus Babeliales bacterium]
MDKNKGQRSGVPIKHNAGCLLLFILICIPSCQVQSYDAALIRIVIDYAPIAKPIVEEGGTSLLFGMVTVWMHAAMSLVSVSTEDLWSRLEKYFFMNMYHSFLSDIESHERKRLCIVTTARSLHRSITCTRWLFVLMCGSFAGYGAYRIHAMFSTNKCRNRVFREQLLVTLSAHSFYVYHQLKLLQQTSIVCQEACALCDEIGRLMKSLYRSLRETMEWIVSSLGQGEQPWVETYCLVCRDLITGVAEYSLRWEDDVLPPDCIITVTCKELIDAIHELQARYRCSYYGEHNNRHDALLSCVRSLHALVCSYNDYSASLQQDVMQLLCKN